jgi:hypothetical protein
MLAPSLYDDPDLYDALLPVAAAQPNYYLSLARSPHTPKRHAGTD